MKVPKGERGESVSEMVITLGAFLLCGYTFLAIFTGGRTDFIFGTHRYSIEIRNLCKDKDSGQVVYLNNGKKYQCN